ncbi:sensor histidine kinase [Streptomyces sp. NPDC085932]|uniref:sensor histidine kinase n=1 Tax=Streptomyces sp. NPDC085932 TaxID=3365741 RepID=UPI0037D6806D
MALTGPNDGPHCLADTFDTMLDRLERAFERQRRFVANDNTLLLLARSDRGLDETESVDLEATHPARDGRTHPTGVGPWSGVHIDLSAHTPLVVRGDAVLLCHVLVNLMRNAIQYNHPGGQVRVRLGVATVTVTDTGVRVPAELISGLFEPFRRLDADRTATTGHGLGLSIAVSLAEAHHAMLTAQPGAQGGLTLTLRFP